MVQLGRLLNVGIELNPGVDGVTVKSRTDPLTNQEIQVVDAIPGAGGIDAFGRVRVSNPATLFESQFTYDDYEGLKWEHIETGGGTITHSSTNRSMTLAIASGTSDAAIMQTRKRMRYEPGKSQRIFITGNFNGGTADVFKRIGYFDDNNGMFFEMNGTTCRVVVRKNASDTATAQSSWNCDTMDGDDDTDNPSGITLDFTKIQIFVIQFEALYAGTVEFGVFVDGLYYAIHKEHSANTLADTYIQDANLPVRYELTKNSVATTEDMEAICCTVMSEGGVIDALGVPFSARRTSVVSINSSGRPAISIRPKSTFNSITNTGYIVPQSLSVYADTKPIGLVVVAGGTLTGASFSSVNADSIVEADQSATAISGGVEMASAYVEKTASISILDLDFPLYLDEGGSHPTTPYTDVLTVFLQSTGAATNCLAAINWKEVR